MVSDPIRVTVWGENVHEREEDHVRALYPDGMHAAVAAGLSARLGDRVSVRTATLDEPVKGAGLAFAKACQAVSVSGDD